MRKLVVNAYMTLDGVIEDPGGGEKFEQGGWHNTYFNDEIQQFQRDGLFGSDTLLLGRVTYEIFAASWPSISDEQGFADRMNSLPKHVVSTTLNTVEWNNSHLIKGNFTQEVS